MVVIYLLAHIELSKLEIIRVIMCWHVICVSRPTDCALAASERVPHSEIAIAVLLHLCTKIAPISLVSCTRVLGG